jgi:hypothetical protein
MANQFRVISLKLDDLWAFTKANKEHSAITADKNGKKYLSILIGDKDEPDQYGKDCYIKVNSKKDAPDASQKVYLGDGKIYGGTQNNQAPAPAQAPQSTSPDLPF